MAPRKRKAEEETPETTVTKRVTRSSTRSAESNEKLKTTSKKGKAEQAQDPSNKKLPNSKGKGKAVAVADDHHHHITASQNKTIVIEHCKQCNQFKKRALLVKDALEKSVSGITVLLNPEKPRRGCFEIREQGKKTFISLLNMKRPFKPMTDLNMEEVIADVIDKIK